METAAGEAATEPGTTIGGGHSIFNTLLQCGEILMQGRKLKVSGGNVADITAYEPKLITPADPVASGTELMTLRMLYYRFFCYPTVRSSDYQSLAMQRKRAFEPKVAVTVTKALSKYISSGVNTIFLAKSGLPLLGNVSLNQALKQSFALLDVESEKLFHRWLYLKLFSKSYFGPAAAGFSVLSGFNCLTASILRCSFLLKRQRSTKKPTALRLPTCTKPYWRLDRELLTMGQTPSKRASFTIPVFLLLASSIKVLWTMAKSLGL